MVAAAAARSCSPRSVADAVLLDLHDLPTLRPQVREEARLVLEAALADDVELRVVAHRSLHESGEGSAIELGQVLAGEECDKVRGGIDGSAVDAIHSSEP